MLIKAFIRFALFAFLSTSLQASHGAGAYLNCRTYNDGKSIELELHLFRYNGANSAQYNSSFTITGPLSFNLVRGTSIIHPVGDSLCPDGTITEYIYHGNAFLGNVLNANDVVLEAIVPCCLLGEMKNLNDSAGVNIRTRISIPTVPSNNGNQYKMVSVNTLNMRVRMLHSARTDQFSVLDFSVPLIPSNVDSIRYHLAQISSTNSYSVYESGFTGLNPLPDQTEDPLNAQNIFDSELGTLSFRARGQSSDTGFYLLSTDYDVYVDSGKVVSMNALGLVYLEYGDSTLNSSLVFNHKDGSNVQVLQHGDTLFRTLVYGDSLSLDLEAYSISGSKILYGWLGGVTDTTGFYGQFQGRFQQPAVLSVGAAIGAQDTIRKRLFWEPTLDDFRYRPGHYNFRLYYRLYTCGSLSQYINVNVELLQEPFIYKTQDTIYTCYAQNLDLNAYFWGDSLFWRPRAGLGDSTQSNINFNPFESGYLYITHPRLGDLDSIYLKLGDLPNRIPLQMTTNGMEMEFTESDHSVYQQWWLNNVIPFHGVLEDENPIIGAGTYNVWSYMHLDSCPNITDTLTIPYNERWGGNSWAGHPESRFGQRVLGEPNNLKYTQKLKITKNRQLQNVYFIGLNSIASSQQVMVELQFASGLYFTRTFNVKDESYIDYPIYYALDTTMEVDISITVPQYIELSLLEGTGASFEHNGLRFSDFRKITGTDTAATNLRPAIGFKFESDISLSEEDFQPIALYPNPASDHLIISAPKGSFWQLHSFSGQMVAEGRLEADIAEIPIDNFSPGFYLLNVDGQNLKFVKE
ncbi:T9SS type A sorting domain-containing protein [Croceimicrobium sp.]|uniref:T9SS type A sorting domain-containing protein n=1 Tax=Croceimicrobium sp. TaxID=2828340 RepID=UPI003BA9E1EB